MKSSKLIMRIMCLVLAIIMLALAFSGIVSMNADAAAVIDENMQVRVGLIYGDEMTEKITIDSDYGFSVGIMTDKRTYMKLGEFPGLVNAIVLVEKNITVDSKTVGNYHLQTSEKFTSYAKAYAKVKEINEFGVHAYVAYIGGYFRVRFGAYASKSAANTNYAAYSSDIPGCTAVSGSGNGTVLYDRGAKRILFECDTDGVHMGTRALQMQTDTKMHYTKLSSGNLYDGVMEFANISGKIRVINVLDIDSYALGVCPWEIYPSWPLETIKAFVCTIRTLAAYHYDARHNSAYGFDVCTSSHCQNYKGMSRDYQNFRTALAETSGQIVTYDGKPIMGIYNGTNGGVTEDVRDIWGGSVLYPYLTSVTIPIEVESHPNHPKGVWTNIVDPTTLSEYLRGRSYTGLNKLTSPIVALNIKQYSKYSGVYIYELEFVDSAGHTATVKTSSNVRGSLVKYCPSAYFSISYNYPLSIVTDESTTTGTMNSSDVNIITADGEYTLSDTTPKDLTVLTSKGEKQFSTSQYTIQFDGKGNGHGGGISMYGAVDLANAGYKYDKILPTYFPGVEVTDLGTPKKDIDYADDGVDDGDDTDIGGEISGIEGCYKMIRTTANVRLRSDASTSSTSIKVLSAGTQLVCTGELDGWCRVFLDDRTVGYVSADYTEALDTDINGGFTAIAKTVTVSSAANLRYEPSTSADKYGIAAEGKELFAVGKGDAWYRVITSDGKVVYITAEVIVEPEETPPDDTEPDDTEPDDTDPDGTAPDDTEPDGTEPDDTEPDDTEPDDTVAVSEVVITTAKVNYRANAGTDNTPLGQLDAATVIVRLEKGSDGWDKIVTPSGEVAYIKSEYLEVYTGDFEGFIQTKATVTTTAKLNLRSEPNTTCTVITWVEAGTSLTCTGISCTGWSRVLTPDGQTAYVSNTYIK